MATLRPELLKVLQRIAEADEAAGGYARFTPYFVEAEDGPIDVSPGVVDHLELTPGRMFALREHRFLEIEPPTSASNPYGPFRLTDAGRDAIARYLDPADPPEERASAVDTSSEYLAKPGAELDARPATPEGRDVFVVHGHDHELRRRVADLLRQLGLQPIVLDEQPNAGLTIIEKFEQHALSVGFAVVLLTPDDVGAAANIAPPDEPNRARRTSSWSSATSWERLGDPESPRYAATASSDPATSTVSSTSMRTATHGSLSSRAR